jgi:hypothetical protein
MSTTATETKADPAAPPSPYTAPVEYLLSRGYKPLGPVSPPELVRFTKWLSPHRPHTPHGTHTKQLVTYTDKETGQQVPVLAQDPNDYRKKIPVVQTLWTPPAEPQTLHEAIAEEIRRGEAQAHAEAAAPLKTREAAEAAALQARASAAEARAAAERAEALAAEFARKEEERRNTPPAPLPPELAPSAAARAKADAAHAEHQAAVAKQVEEYAGMADGAEARRKQGLAPFAKR